MNKTDQQPYFVPKPWGREYICWESKDCAIWYLEILHGKSTSFHCHVEKNTGLVALSGLIELTLINSSYKLYPLEKINIFRGRFHKSTSLSMPKAALLEVESPVNKSDLVRWEDSHGRLNSNYESERESFKNGEPFLYLGSPENYVESQKFEDINYLIFNQKRLSVELKIQTDSVYILLVGSIYEADITKSIVIPGDAVSAKILNLLIKRFAISSDALFLKIFKE